MIKRLKDLTRKQQREYERNSGVYKLGVLQEGDTEVKFIIENNTKEEIAEFMKDAYVTGPLSDHLIPLYLYNRLYEYLHGLPKTGHGLYSQKTSEAQRRATAKYDAENTVQVHLKLNKITDADILERLEQVENKQGYIKELIREEINRRR